MDTVIYEYVAFIGAPPAVQIIEPGRAALRMNRASLQSAIANVKACRGTFKTQSAYDYRLALYQNALAFLDEQEKAAAAK